MASSTGFATVLLLLICGAIGNIVNAKVATTTEIKGRLRLPNDVPGYLNSTRLSLSDGGSNHRSTYLRSDGTFSFYGVGPGVHLLEVHSATYAFSHVKIQLLESSPPEPKCVQYAFVGAEKRVVPHPLVLTAHASYNYFDPPRTFSLLGLLRNPMVLMMGFGVVVMFAMPAMMEGMDDEQRQQMQRNMEMQQDPSKMLGQLWGDFSGASAEPEPPAVRARPAAAASAGARPARRNKRG